MTKADALRAALKTAGYSRRQVTVRHDGCSLDVTIRDLAVPKSAIKAIAGSFENIRRCEASGEILGGGNTFLTVEYVRELLDTAALPIAEVLAAATANTTVEIAGRKVSKMAPSTGRWDWTVVSFDDVEPRIHCHVSGGDTADQLMFAARQLAEGAIEIAAKLPACAKQMGCLCAYHAAGGDATHLCDATEQEAPERCEGCDETGHELATYTITFVGGTKNTGSARYCADCRDLAAMNWNGETAAIAPQVEDWAAGLEAR